ncbi:hypothetical protein LEN26_018210 [Aphanomyces euteiches]|nr:hypothetical protein LEN26_018210 [Aphanomyces euteiches]KAH9111458.1 hypothetical protein AeMF1_014024 [Aphanomyces euteiches]KAH9191369.1 hypothetical protein AeNC1_006649 [Aphanomyces euteiches]
MAETARSRLNSVYALVDEMSLRRGEESAIKEQASSLWDELQARGLNETDAWLCGAVVKRLALAACSPMCKASDHIVVIGKLSEAKQTNEADRVYIASAQCSALRHLHAVKPAVVRPHVNTTQFVPVVRQSANMMDERKQREEVLKICRDVLLSADSYDEAENMCVEFIDNEGSLSEIAIDGLLSLAAKGHILPFSLIATTQALVSTAKGQSNQLAALRLFRVVATQHAKRPGVIGDALNLLCTHSMHRSPVIRREVAHAFRFFPPPTSATLSQLLLKTPLEDGASHLPTEVLQTGVLLSLLEDQDVDVRCEASRSMVTLCRPVLRQETNRVEPSVAALEKAITAHADLVHAGSIDAKLQITRSLVMLLQQHRRRGHGGFAFTPEQMEYLVAGAPASLEHAVSLLAVVSACELRHIHHASQAMDFTTTVESLSNLPTTTAALKKHMQAQVAEIRRRAFALLELDATLHAKYCSLQHQAEETLSNASTSSRVFLLAAATPASPVRGSLVSILPQSADLKLKERQIQAARAAFSGSTTEQRYGRQVVDILEATTKVTDPNILVDKARQLLVQFPSTPRDAVHEVIKSAQAILFAADDMRWTHQDEALALLRTHFPTVSTRDELLADAQSRLGKWWPAQVLEHVPQTSIYANVDTTSVDMVVGWTSDVPVHAIVYGLDDPTVLTIQVGSKDEGFYYDVLPRDIEWLDRHVWRIRCAVPVTFNTEFHPSLDLTFCVKTTLPSLFAQDEAVVVSISPRLPVSLTLSRSVRAATISVAPAASPTHRHS